MANVRELKSIDCREAYTVSMNVVSTLVKMRMPIRSTMAVKEKL